MKAILKREISSFFSSSMGYLVIIIFLIINGLFLWVFDGSYNILDNGFADLTSFFDLAPWVFLFLIPAVTMRSFSEEMKMGTLELLLTKPITIKGIVLGKYFGALILIFLALIPTLLYIITIDQLIAQNNVLDTGSLLGSYIGILFLVMAYTSIGIFASTLSNNQIISFITGVLLCFLVYYGFEGLAGLLQNGDLIENLGMKAHFNSMARGVIDTRDLIYFMSVSMLFIALAIFKLRKEE
jgi:ABC-2 type transport system permease protein